MKDEPGVRSAATYSSFLFPFALLVWWTLYLWLAALAQADFQGGVAAYNQGDYASALKEFRALAEQGDAAAQSYLGLMHYKGDGVPQDYKKARTWFLRAARKGNVTAQFNLGLMYQHGQGPEQNDFYYQRARWWYGEAAKQGHAAALLNRGVMSHQGLGGKLDVEEARRWYVQAASLGSPGAFFKLGKMHEDGDGVNADFVQAYTWYALAAMHGVEPATIRRDFMAEKMSPVQLFQAQQLTREWRPTKLEISPSAD